MTIPRFAIILSLTLTCVQLTQAGPGLFRKTPKPTPEERVPVLLQMLKSDPEDKKRTSAAEELAEYDPKAFPEIMPTLIDALKKDSNVWVRRAAAKSIGEIRPISQQGGYALEVAMREDSAFVVRTAASTSLGLYRILGYRTGKSDLMPNETEEPPLAAQLNPINSSKMPVGPRVTPTMTPTVPLIPTRPAPPLMGNRNDTEEPPPAPPKKTVEPIQLPKREPTPIPIQIPPKVDPTLEPPMLPKIDFPPLPKPEPIGLPKSTPTPKVETPEKKQDTAPEGPALPPPPK